VESQLAKSERSYRPDNHHVRFLNGHDNPRIASVAARDGKIQCSWASGCRGDQLPPLAYADAAVYERLRRGLTVLYTMPGVPYLYAGDEVAFGGGLDPDMRPVTDASRNISLAENKAVFYCFAAGHIAGIMEQAEESALFLTDDYVRYPEVVAEALGKLRNLGIAGPYGIALGPRCYVGLTETTTGGGYRVYDHVKRLLNGPVVWTPGIDGAVVLSMRGGDFELTVGEDLSIGYLDHGRDTVRLYLQESLTFRVLTAEAAIPLRYRGSKPELAPPAGAANRRPAE
jgi:hypothetical protein